MNLRPITNLKITIVKIDLLATLFGLNAIQRFLYKI
jgi:hypothetical protein